MQRRTTSAFPVFSSISRIAAEPQTGQIVGNSIRLGAPPAAFPKPARHLRDDVAGALDADRVADANILARDLVFVVQRRVGDDDAADRHRIEPRDGRQRAGAPDLNFDVAQNGRRLFGREFMRRRPARRARDEAQAFLQREAIDLVDDAVDVIAERSALALDVVIMASSSSAELAEHGQRIDRQPIFLEGRTMPICVRPACRLTSPQA